MSLCQCCNCQNVRAISRRATAAHCSMQAGAEERLDEAAPQQAARGSRLTPAVTLSALLAATVLCWLFLA